jgi:hypothetical protein
LQKGSFHTTLFKMSIMVLIPVLALTSATANAQDTGNAYGADDSCYSDRPYGDCSVGLDCADTD